MILTDTAARRHVPTAERTLSRVLHGFRHVDITPHINCPAAPIVVLIRICSNARRLYAVQVSRPPNVNALQVHRRHAALRELFAGRVLVETYATEPLWRWCT